MEFIEGLLPEWGPHWLMLLVLVVPLVTQRIPRLRPRGIPTFDITGDDPSTSEGREIALGCLTMLYIYSAVVVSLYYLLNPGAFTLLQFTRPHLPFIIGGSVVALAGVALSLWARFALGKNWVGGFQLHDSHQLVVHGPYRWVRHPMYVGFMVTAVAITVATMNALPIFTEVLYRTILVVRATREERNLAAKFGQEYYAYRGRTGKFFPRLRRRA